jgi:gas vesicle protein
MQLLLKLLLGSGATALGSVKLAALLNPLLPAGPRSCTASNAFVIVTAENEHSGTNSQSPGALLQERNSLMGNDNDNISTRLTYLLIGGGIGAVIALLFAPKSGQELRGDLADATRKGIDKSRETAQQLGERAGEYYESTRERAGEIYSQAASKASDVYSQASEKVSEVAQTARATAARQTSTVAAALDAGKKAYQEEKRKTELSGRIEAAPHYTEKPN